MRDVLRIIDRRYDSRNKSASNRARFLKRFRGQIRKAVADAISRRSIKEIDKDERIGIPAKDISEPNFRYGRGGRWTGVLPGNDRLGQDAQAQQCVHKHDVGVAVDVDHRARIMLGHVAAAEVLDAHAGETIEQQHGDKQQPVKERIGPDLPALPGWGALCPGGEDHAQHGGHNGGDLPRA